MSAAMPVAWIRIAGRLQQLSGLMLLLYWYAYVVFMPYGELSTSLSILVLEPAWTPINAIGVAGALAGLMGIPGWYAAQAAVTGAAGGRAALVALAGSALLLGPMLWDTIVWPALAHHDPALLDFDGPIYASAAFVPFFVSAGLVWALGMGWLGLLTARAGVLPPWAGYLVAIGAPLFGLGGLLGKMQALPRSVGITCFSVGVVWIGTALARADAREATEG